MSILFKKARSDRTQVYIISAVSFMCLKMTPRHHVEKKCLVKLNKVLVRDVNLF